MVAIVTGGSRGIGYAVAELLLSMDYHVIISARGNSSNIDILQSKYSDRAIFVKCDISIASDRERLISRALAVNGKIDLLINNAGVAPISRKDMLDITESDYDYVMDINLKGGYFMSQSVARCMRNQLSGRIINISSISAYTASVNRAEYCLSKAGISMMTKLFAARMSEYSVGVYEILPGIIDTDMTSAVKDKYQSMISEGLTPIPRMGKPSDIASCVAAIAEGKLDFCTGQSINADGGFHIRRL